MKGNIAYGVSFGFILNIPIMGYLELPIGVMATCFYCSVFMFGIGLIIDEIRKKIKP